MHYPSRPSAHTAIRIIPAWLFAAATIMFAAPLPNGEQPTKEDLLSRAEAGDANSQYELAARYMVVGEERLAWLEKAAKSGHARAQTALGLEYQYSAPAESAKWYKMAAASGDPAGMLGFAAALTVGTGVPADKAQAHEWLYKAASAGYSQAQLCLGSELLHGLSCPKSPAEGIRWLTAAAKHGHLDAMLALGEAYEDGTDVPRDYQEAIRWYQEGAINGGRESKFRLGRRHYLNSLNGGTPTYDLAFRCFKDCAMTGHQRAQYFLACCFADGRGVAKDEIEALAWFNIVAASGDQDAAAAQTRLERKIGAQSTLVSQKRSKEIQAEIDNPSIPPR